MAKDVLDSLLVIRHTKIILGAKKEEERIKEKAGRELTRVAVKIGKSLIAVKEFLDTTTDKEAWLRWLRSHIQYSRHTAERYMRLARFAAKKSSAALFTSTKLSSLYHISSRPDEIVGKLAPDTFLTDPKTGKQKPLMEMSERALDRALDALEGRYGILTPKAMLQRLEAIDQKVEEISTQSQKLPATKWENFKREIAEKLGLGSTDGKITAKTKEEFAEQFNRKLQALTQEARRIDRFDGRLGSSSKEKNLSDHEVLRVVLLKWPAWAKAKKRS